MEEDTLRNMKAYVDTANAVVVDERTTGGEVVKIPILNLMQLPQALLAVANNVAMFMERVTGRGYQKAEEVYDQGYTIREPGHQAYGVKVTVEENCVIVSRVAILEDETIFDRYVKYLQTGILV